jgi:1-aminocyclopropane-1-carboxylate deaminase/D-cysteine desulfhydrase-like pyridoxal-dependent ACC family enzyme
MTNPMKKLSAVALTPLQQVGNILLKRDDRFEVAGVGVRGGKVRACWAMAQGAPGLVTAGQHASSQVKIVISVAKTLGLPCAVHMPTGKLDPELEAAQAAGVIVTQHPAGRDSNIFAKARDDARERGWREIPFGMESDEAVQQTAAQAYATVAKIREQGATVRRVVVPVGSGISLAGILRGFAEANFTVPVVGIWVGKDPTKRLDRWAQPNWRDLCRLEQAGIDFRKPAPNARQGDVELDPIFEAKCLPSLEPGDLFWVVGSGQAGKM